MPRPAVAGAPDLINRDKPPFATKCIRRLPAWFHPPSTQPPDRLRGEPHMDVFVVEKLGEGSGGSSADRA